MESYITNVKDVYMLDETKTDYIEGLCKDVPRKFKSKNIKNLRQGMSDVEILNYLKSIGSKNKSLNDLICFLGAGAYDHYIPATIKHMAMKSHFFHGDIPYRPQIRQGALQVIHEYETMINNLTGMDACNGLIDDGPTACVQGALMACKSTKRKSILISKTVNPQVRSVLKTHMKYRYIDVIEVDMVDGVTDMDKVKDLVKDDVAGIIIQSPNFFGIIEDYTEAEKIIHEKNGLLITYVDPISLGILKRPDEQGADIVVGEAQSFGNSLNYGGPFLGFIATKSELSKNIFGRRIDLSIDEEGRQEFHMKFQGKRAYMDRYNSTSHKLLNVLIGSIYLSTLGKKGLREVAIQCVKNSHYAFDEITKSGKFKPVFNRPFFKEFMITSDLNSSEINEKLLKKGIIGGYEVQRDYDELENSLLLCVTEKRSKKEIDKLSKILEAL
ncbi:aminomethyl-transferring glycine dehydrogenase subunit GcvPA [Anaeromicrobium sediminis]|uniref:Glycine dehydrogenase (Aminomethyl-transferring) n=1 Tax=Anaeromicrobium sediminis TaxID=1478221 RepID=A0A267MFN4_9FIRM|nr:aminomethyl-transferring glycine dehydrogenase subunit GcvPA [Anaeromicrobium sediminis]PAB57718.1 glycine dehydrogenase (aminomethyl-transferring) [Anaeromicrobium sediminis]